MEGKQERKKAITKIKIKKPDFADSESSDYLSPMNDGGEETVRRKRPRSAFIPQLRASHHKRT